MVSRREQTYDEQVRRGAQRLRYERIGGLLDTVVDELVRALQVLDQLQTNGVPESRTDVLVRFPENDRKHRDLGDAAEAGELLQRRLGLDGQTGQPPDHEVHHSVGVAVGVNAIELPAPARRVMIEAEQPLFGERRNELNGEKRIAARPLVHQLRKRGGTARRAAERIRDEPPHVFPGERRKTDLLHECSRLADSIELPHQRMSAIDLIVPVRADQHQVLQIRLGQHILEQVERRRVEPLQIVQKKRQRMLGPREDAEKPPEHQLETALCLLRRQLQDGRLLADQELQFGDHVDYEPRVRAQRLAERIAPAGELGVALAQKRADQALKRLRQRRIGDVALVMVELSGGEKAARRHQRLVQLVDDGGLADARVARYQNPLRPPAGDDAVEGGEQRLDLPLSPV